MLFRQLIDYDTNTYTYLIADENSREAVIIDPVYECVDKYINLIHELNLKLLYSLETHIHADHITAAFSLKQKLNNKIIVPENARVKNADKFIKNNEELLIGKIFLKAIATPGHTDAHMAYYINHDRILTGDALLIRGCGRTDFQSGNAGLLWDVIHQKIFSLPENTLIFSGHDYNGNTCSSVYEEKNFNPRLTKTRDEFIQLMNHLNLPYPKQIDIAVPANEKCGEK